MSMGDSWSYVATDNYKSTNRLIHLLIDIVAKGGNFLLNVGPSPEGTLPPTAVERLQDMGKWLNVNGKAIYGTRPCLPYCCGEVRFTQSKDGQRYALLLCPENQPAPANYTFKGLEKPVKTGKAAILGTSEKATVTKKGDEYTVTLPKGLRQKAKDAIVVVL
jgi:alpha-L-fucosidase